MVSWYRFMHWLTGRHYALLLVGTSHSVCRAEYIGGEWWARVCINAWYRLSERDGRMLTADVVEQEVKR